MGWFGSSKSKTLLFNDLLFGRWATPTDLVFFEVSHARIPLSLRFPHHPGISLADFCANSGFS
jgi:hypothetical protein